MNISQIVIILENPKYGGNIGMAARLVANYSLSPLRIFGPVKKPDFEMDWMAKHSGGELEKIIYFDSISVLKKDLDLLIGTGMIQGKDRGVFLNVGTELVQKVNEMNGLVGIAFGREDRGLSRDFIDQCDYMVDFQLPGNQKSMNISHAIAHILSSLFNHPSSKKNEKIEGNSVKLTESEMKGFYEYANKLFEHLELNQFHGSENLAIKRLKKILGNAGLSIGDRDFLFRILRRIDEKLR